MFGKINEEMIEFMDNRLGALLVELAAGQFGGRTLGYRDFHACGAIKFFRKKDLISIRRFILDMESDF